MWIKLENNSVFSGFLPLNENGNLECRFTNGKSASINWNIAGWRNNGTKAHLFVNGIKVKTANTENSSTRFKPTIGKASWFNGNYFNGIDDFSPQARFPKKSKLFII